MGRGLKLYSLGLGRRSWGLDNNSGDTEQRRIKPGGIYNDTGQAVFFLFFVFLIHKPKYGTGKCSKMCQI